MRPYQLRFWHGDKVSQFEGRDVAAATVVGGPTLYFTKTVTIELVSDLSADAEFPPQSQPLHTHGYNECLCRSLIPQIAGTAVAGDIGSLASPSTVRCKGSGTCANSIELAAAPLVFVPSASPVNLAPHHRV